MKAINNFENVQATTGEFNKPTAGGYCIEILAVKDVPMNEQTGKGDYLKIDYDICHGEFAGYYTKQNEKFGGDWFANFIRSYKESAAGMFKHFINCVEESNAGYKWAWDEKSLVHKYVGVVLGEEEYQKRDGSVGRPPRNLHKMRRHSLLQILFRLTIWMICPLIDFKAVFSGFAVWGYKYISPYHKSP